MRIRLGFLKQILNGIQHLLYPRLLLIGKNQPNKPDNMKISKEESDRLFNTITANGCREMDEDRFYQAVNEAATVLTQSNEEAMKERAWEAWQDSTCSLDVAYDGNEKAEETFDKWYDKKYGSDEKIDKR